MFAKARRPPSGSSANQWPERARVLIYSLQARNKNFALLHHSRPCVPNALPAGACDHRHQRVKIEQREGGGSKRERENIGSWTTNNERANFGPAHFCGHMLLRPLRRLRTGGCNIFASNIASCPGQSSFARIFQLTTCFSTPATRHKWSASSRARPLARLQSKARCAARSHYTPHADHRSSSAHRR